MVSWIRRDVHPVILSSGDVVFTSDPRISVTNPPGTEDWVLSIAQARMTDRGHYECQVNTEPKINLGFRLNVLRKLSVVQEIINIRRRRRCLRLKKDHRLKATSLKDLGAATLEGHVDNVDHVVHVGLVSCSKLL